MKLMKSAAYICHLPRYSQSEHKGKSCDADSCHTFSQAPLSLEAECGRFQAPCAMLRFISPSYSSSHSCPA